MARPVLDGPPGRCRSWAQLRLLAANTSLNAAVGMLAVAVVLGVSGCTADTEPRPVRSVASSQPTPTVGVVPRVPTSWFRSALPVDGSIVGLAGAASGTVRITRDGSGISIAFSDLHTAADSDADLRVQLSSGDVGQGPDGTAMFPAGTAGGGLLGTDPIEVGVLADGSPDAVVTFGSPQILPEVHALLVVDYTTNTVLAGAELIPAEG